MKFHLRLISLVLIVIGIILACKDDLNNHSSQVGSKDKKPATDEIQDKSEFNLGSISKNFTAKYICPDNSGNYLLVSLIYEPNASVPRSYMTIGYSDAKGNSGGSVVEGNPVMADNYDYQKKKMGFSASLLHGLEGGGAIQNWVFTQRWQLDKYNYSLSRSYNFSSGQASPNYNNYIYSCKIK